LVWAASREYVQQYFESSDGSCLEVTFLEKGTLNLFLDETVSNSGRLRCFNVVQVKTRNFPKSYPGNYKTVTVVIK